MSFTILATLLIEAIVSVIVSSLVLGSVAYAAIFLFPVVFILLVIPIVYVILQTMIVIMYSVAASVSCFEEQNYGVAAFKRAKKLLHKNWRSALNLFGPLVTPLIVILVPVIGVFSNQKLTPDQWFEWTPVLVLTFSVIIGSYTIEVQYICCALFYLACVADSDENSTIHGEDLLEAGYDSLPMASSRLSLQSLNAHEVVSN
ncbi:hypothetical protein R1sor_014629 [Riccia sorocarpa]|uniref:Uncharacterized protein n=1 Tax=Riccia sorocarpa TaxID=122646 RepID=A0ABD3H9Y5_9MARC